MFGIIVVGTHTRTRWATKAIQDARRSPLPFAEEPDCEQSLSEVLRKHAGAWSFALVIRKGLVWCHTPRVINEMIDVAIHVYGADSDALFSSPPRETSVACTLANVPRILSGSISRPKVRCFDPPLALIDWTARVPYPTLLESSRIDA